MMKRTGGERTLTLTSEFGNECHPTQNYGERSSDKMRRFITVVFKDISDFIDEVACHSVEKDVRRKL